MAYNQYGNCESSKDYERVLLMCSRCETPIYVNRFKDAPKFCPVCHCMPSWEYADENKKWNGKEWVNK